MTARSSRLTLGLLMLSLTAAAFVGRASDGQAPAEAEIEEHVPLGDVEHLTDCRLVHLRIHEMSGYELKKLRTSAWNISYGSPDIVNGVRYIWRRASDGFELDASIGKFHSAEEAARAADIRLDELGLAPEPVSRSRAGEGKAKFQAKAPDGEPIGEHAWHRRAGDDQMQVVFRRGNAVIHVQARGWTDATTPELMGLSRVMDARITRP